MKFDVCNIILHILEYGYGYVFLWLKTIKQNYDKRTVPNLHQAVFGSDSC